MELSQKEIRKRLRDYENLKKCHVEMKERQEKLKKEVKRLKEENKEIPELRKDVQDLKLQIEELKQIIFGKKKKSSEEDEEDLEFGNTGKKERKGGNRKKSSYQRKTPDQSEITKTAEHHLGGQNGEGTCPDCGTRLRRTRIRVYYEEDILLPEENENGDKQNPMKEVTEHHVEQGWCPKCKKWHSAKDLPSSKVVIGKKVRVYICYLSILLRISHPQIQRLLSDAYGFEISLGEIANTLEDYGEKLRPEFERIRKRLQEGRGNHLDETGWGKLYLWVMASMDTDDVLYLAGKNRGGGHVDDLLGKNYEGVRISDAYPGYKNKAGVGQQCWAHPHRKLRDLANSRTLEKGLRPHHRKAYEEFSEVYRELRECLDEKFDPVKRAEQKAALWRRIQAFREPQEQDTTKLKNLRKQFFTYEAEWLNCMDYEGVPCDNNKAERMLRHFVIKRKISFGTRNEKTSRNFETLATVFMTYRKKSQKSL